MICTVKSKILGVLTIPKLLNTRPFLLPPVRGLLEFLVVVLVLPVEAPREVGLLVLMDNEDVQVAVLEGELTGTLETQGGPGGGAEGFDQESGWDC